MKIQMAPSPVIAAEQLERAIFFVRGHRVMLDRDLASLYGVSTKALNQAVKRNDDRFPEDFMFQLTWDEGNALRSQFVTLKRGKHLKYQPYAFTEQGVAMLSSVLKSKRAAQVNIEIMRAFVRLRRMLIEHQELSRRLDDLEKKYDSQFKAVFDAIRQMMNPPPESQRRIGFRQEDWNNG